MNLEKTIAYLHSHLKKFEKSRYINAKQVEFVSQSVVEETLWRNLGDLDENQILSMRSKLPVKYGLKRAYKILTNSLNKIHNNTILLETDLDNRVPESGWVKIGENMYQIESGYVADEKPARLTEENLHLIGSYRRILPTEKLKMFNGGEKYYNPLLEMKMKSIYDEYDEYFSHETNIGCVNDWTISFSILEVSNNVGFNLRLLYKHNKTELSVITKCRWSLNTYEIFDFKRHVLDEPNYTATFDEYFEIVDYVKNEYNMNLPTSEQIEGVLLDFVGMKK